MPASSTEGTRNIDNADSLSPLSLYTPLSDMIRRAPVVYPPGTALRVVLDHMHRERIGSIVVADPQHMQPLGILTFNEVLSGVVQGNGDLSRPVEQVMNPRFATLPVDARAHEAILVMARRNTRYVLVLEKTDGRLAGVVSRSDIYSAQRIASEGVVNAVISARSIAELASATLDLRAFTHRLIAQGLTAEQIIQWITSLNDLVSLQAIDLMRERFDLPEVAWCWLAFGSEGRFEQTFATDQDNGIVFDVPDGSDAESLRARFLPFAQAVNQALDDCGFPLCKGQIMAGNPMWCLSLDEWRARFTNWIDEGDPKALLNASIFFDFRPLYGERWLYEMLAEHMLGKSRHSQRFLHLMAKNALESPPPLGFLRAFRLDRNREHPNTIDLKSAALRPYVDSARLFALANGISATSTIERLRAAAAMDSFSQEDLLAAIDGFHFVQKLRLRNQLAQQRNPAAANRINPYHLNALERQVLKHSLRRAKALQARVRVDYRL